MNIGMRPTMENGSEISLEVHILDFEEDIYHQEIKVKFIHKIRDEIKFDSIEQLIQQLKKDKEFVVSLIY
jgi:riboflavin kinase/FMN adenylyltransferase